jgi:tetratricopeptide (TPR) repeat protein
VGQRAAHNSDRSSVTEVICNEEQPAYTNPSQTPKHFRHVGVAQPTGRQGLLRSYLREEIRLFFKGNGSMIAHGWDKMEIRNRFRVTSFLLTMLFLAFVPVSALSQTAGDRSSEFKEQLIAAYKANDFTRAKHLLKELVAAEPDQPDAWAALAELQMQDGEVDDAIASAEEQLRVNPKNRQANQILIFAYSTQRRFENAVAAGRRQLILVPDDAETKLDLAGALANAGHHEEATKYFEAAAAAKPNDDRLNYSLAFEYFQQGAVEKALAIVDRIANTNLGPYFLDNMAYQLARRNLMLDKAWAYAQKAETGTATDLNKVVLRSISRQDLWNVNILASEWRTLGLIQLQRGNLSGAQAYLQAAWRLQPYVEYADLLVKVYQKQGKFDQALKLSTLAQAAPRLPKTNADIAEQNATLTAPLGVPGTDPSLRELEEIRTVRLDRKSKETGTADFWVLMGASGIEDWQFISGDEYLRSWGDALKLATPPLRLPDNVNVKIIRRGILSCYSLNQECKFVFVEPREFLGND